MSDVAAEDPAWPEMQGAGPDDDERGRRWLRMGAVVGLVLAAAFALLWLTRDRIADNVIAGKMRQLGVPGTYRIDSVGPRRQVLSNIVIGKPGSPDLTIERAEVEIAPRFGFPAIGRITLLRPRLYGTLKQGKLSFGTLDKALSGSSDGAPFRLPDLDIAIEDGRGRLITDYGPVGLRLDGRGGLRGGFSGTLAAAAPGLAVGRCGIRNASLYGKVSVTAERPRLEGPARLGSLDCGTSGPRLRDAALGIDGTADQPLDGGTVSLNIAAGAMSVGPARASGLNGKIDATWRKGALTARYDLLGRGLRTPQIDLATLAATGSARARDRFGKTEIDGTVDGGGVRLGEAMGNALARYERAAGESLLAPLLRQTRASLVREGRGSKLAGEFILRQTGGDIHLVVPQGRLQGGSGSTLLALSRVQFTSGSANGAAAPRLAGNFFTGGAGLPKISGRMERGVQGDTLVRMTMAEYGAGDRNAGARLAIPRLVVAQTRNGAIGFSGNALASGPLPGGYARNLAIGFDGNRSPAGVLALWRKCTQVRFDALAYANLALDRHSLLVCPGPGGSIIRSDTRGTTIALGIPSIDLSGRLGETPVRLSSGPIGFARPGVLYARVLDVTLGPPDTATRVHLADLTARVGKDIAGTFAGTEMRLAAVPMDVTGASGNWRYADGRLDLTGAEFRLTDRVPVARFQPLVGRGTTLSLFNNVIKINALLHEPATDREIAELAITHDLATARGHADLNVKHLAFDKALQPDMLTRQLLGVVANASGAIHGRGAIDWNASGVTSSGRFGTDSLDFAAAFGPVKGASGTIVFRDLINLVTPPGQRLRIASVNPGIEVADGEVLFQLKPGSQLAVEGGTWPFLGGTLRLQPVDINIGVAETRRYVLDIAGIEATRFIQQMELANLSATGRFDGALPLVFDQNGGRIEGGLLTSRPPGGTVAYVGALTYKDLSPIANFAFDALKSLNYRKMRIAMDGALQGNLVTRVRFDGVTQGVGAKRNLITRRFANLPLQFNVNVRAPFYQLITSFKSIYDPSYVRDPRTIGLIGADGRPVEPSVAGERDVQPPVSDKTPQRSPN
ncbi:MAG: YdbH domain-containing protein [Pseudomonadota bacterium]